MKHTPTPWKVSASGGLIVPDNGNPIATICRGFGRDEEEFPNCPANARRIVACVNACEGIPTKDFEGKHINDIFTEITLEKNRLEVQNARLLAALKGLIQVIEFEKTGGDQFRLLWLDQARAAIAEADYKLLPLSKKTLAP